MLNDVIPIKLIDTKTQKIIKAGKTTISLGDPYLRYTCKGKFQDLDEEDKVNNGEPYVADLDVVALGKQIIRVSKEFVHEEGMWKIIVEINGSNYSFRLWYESEQECGTMFEKVLEYHKEMLKK